MTIYCIRLLDIRFVRGESNPDVRAMRKLTEIFGNEFWSNTIIVLTFANILEPLNVEWKRFSPDDKGKAFTAKIEQWKEQIQEILIGDVQVPEAIVKSISMIPAGHYGEPHLPGRRFWLSTLWWYSLGTIQIPEKQAALVEINCNRLKREVDVKEEDFKKPLEQQPIIFSERVISGLKNAGQLSVHVGTIVEAVIGAGIGVSGLAIGAVAAFIPPQETIIIPGPLGSIGTFYL